MRAESVDHCGLGLVLVITLVTARPWCAKAVRPHEEGALGSRRNQAGRL
jgi:hypothetical protein